VDAERYFSLLAAFGGPESIDESIDVQAHADRASSAVWKGPWN